MPTRRGLLKGATALAAAAVVSPVRAAAAPALRLDTPMRPPEWALLERELLRANTAACEEFYARYFDERGYFLCFERWGANDGPDDAIENVNDWAHLHALGAPDRILEMYRQAQEGNFRQYTAVRTIETPLGREGMYFREFPTQMDWQHLSEGLSTFNLMGLSDPYNAAYRARARRFANFFNGSDPSAPNYDPKNRIIRSTFTGSRGPLLRKATPLDWAGDPFEAGSRFFMEHGETTYQQTLDHYNEYTDTVGDNPLNLNATSLALDAYMLDNEPKYRAWLIEYADAWVARAKANNDILPSNIGLDGRVGGETGGKWWGGVYGWGFSPVVPQTGKRADRNRVPRSIVGFLNAYLVSGDDRYLEVWRRQADRINAQAKTVNGKSATPRMYGEQGWYSYQPGLFDEGMGEVYYMSMNSADKARTRPDPWWDFLEGRNVAYPVARLREDLDGVREKVAKQRADTSTPDTRLADHALEWTPACVTSLIQLMEGGLHIGRPGWSPASPAQGGALLHCRLRYFDPERRRAGIPEDVAALVETMSDGAVGVTLVNVGQVSPRKVVIQAGAYGEHQVLSVARKGGPPLPVDASSFTVDLAPGAGERIDIRMKRFANQPRIAFPWDR